MPTMPSGQHLINDALKMISGCIIPSSVVTNSGSLSTTYIGSVLSGSHGSAEMDSVNSVTLSSTSLHHDVCHISGLKACAFAATLFPVSAVLQSCFSCQKTSTDAAVYQSLTLTFGAGTVFIFVVAVLKNFYRQPAQSAGTAVFNSLRGAILRFFALQGRHVIPIEVKFGVELVEESTFAQFLKNLQIFPIFQNFGI